MNKPKQYWLNQSDMAKSCGVSPTAFKKWDVQPVDKIGRSVYYCVADVLANRLEHSEERLKKWVDSLSDSALSKEERKEKLRLTKAQAEWQELKNAKERRELAPVHIIEWVIGKACGQLSAMLDALPGQMKNRNPKLTASDIEVITREIAKAQNATARMTLNIDEYPGE